MILHRDFLPAERPTRKRIDNLNAMPSRLVGEGELGEVDALIRALPMKQRAKSTLVREIAQHVDTVDV